MSDEHEVPEPQYAQARAAEWRGFQRQEQRFLCITCAVSLAVLGISVVVLLRAGNALPLTIAALWALFVGRLQLEAWRDSVSCGGIAAAYELDEWPDWSVAPQWGGR